MPELPEVETIRLGINKSLPTSALREVKVFRPNLRFEIPDKNLLTMTGQKLKPFDRRGKFLIFESESHKFISHLGMTGHWRYETKPNFKKHDHIAFVWDKKILVYNDPRRFGYVLNFTEDTFKNFGPDPILDIIDINNFFESGKKSNTPIKSWLLNQKNILGVGNIYASEILFKSKINPKKLTSKINFSDWKLILENTILILQEAIDRGGSSLRDYKNVEGKQGDMQNYWLVYGKEKNQCLSCLTKIKKIIQSNRSSYFCPKCQK